MQLLKFKQNYFLIIVSIVSTLLFIGSAFPYGFPLFSPSVLILFFLYFFTRKDILFDKFILFYLLLIIIYILPLGIFGTLSPKNIIDLGNGIMVLIFFVLFVQLSMVGILVEGDLACTAGKTAVSSLHRPACTFIELHQ